MFLNECCRSITASGPYPEKICCQSRKNEREKQDWECARFFFYDLTSLNKPSLHGRLPSTLRQSRCEKTARLGNSRPVIFHSPAVFKRLTEFCNTTSFTVYSTVYYVLLFVVLLF